MNLSIVGIDVSLRSTGIALITLPSLEIHLDKIVPKKVLSIPAKQMTIVSATSYYIAEADIIVFEDFGIGYRYGVTGRLLERVELLGMLKFVGFNYGKIVTTVSVSMIKQFAAGKASADKKDVKEGISSLFNITPNSYDESDALSAAAIVACYIDLFIMKSGACSSAFQLDGKKIKVIDKFGSMYGEGLKHLLTCGSKVGKVVVH